MLYGVYMEDDSRATHEDHDQLQSLSLDNKMTTHKNFGLYCGVHQSDVTPSRWCLVEARRETDGGHSNDQKRL